MNDLERRLRAALRAASEQAPAGMMEAIARRHRRHQVRLGTSLVAVAAAVALAVTPVAHALRDGSAAGGPAGSGSVPAGGSASKSRSVPPHRHAHVPLAASGTFLSGCAEANQGILSANWRSGSSGSTTPAGPLWFLDGGHSTGRLRVYVDIVVLESSLKPGSVVVVKVAPAGRPHLRFLYGPADSLQPGTRYTMRSGESGVTFEACPPVPPGITSYYGGFLVDGARCVPVQVWPPDRSRPILIRLGACAGH